jgi:hypothetical protein
VIATASDLIVVAVLFAGVALILLPRHIRRPRRSTPDRLSSRTMARYRDEDGAK